MSDEFVSPRGLPIKDVLPLGRVRRVMARTMMESVGRAALSQIARQVDLTGIQDKRRQETQAGSLSLNVYLLAAVARTLPRHPLLNAELVDEHILVYERVNLGMAIAIPDGLIVGVIHNADRMTLTELAVRAEDLALRARTGALQYGDIDGGTFTVSNMGMLGVDSAFALPRPPEAAILLIGRARGRAEFLHGKIVQREEAWFSLTYDHRFIDGATGAEFLQDVEETLRHPDKLP